MIMSFLFMVALEYGYVAPAEGADPLGFQPSGI
jgi:hypothetical protein